MKKQLFVLAMIVSVVLGLSACGEAASNDAQSQETASVEPVAEQQPELTPEEQAAKNAQDKSNFIASCKTYTYKQVARDPDTYIEKPAHFMGQVSQVIEGDEYNIFMINVTYGEYDIWTDQIYVQYTLPKGASRILVDDIVDVYGYMAGVQTYETVLGDQNTIPALYALYIDLAK